MSIFAAFFLLLLLLAELVPQASNDMPIIGRNICFRIKLTFFHIQRLCPHFYL
jgi:hypothetical protein